MNGSQRVTDEREAGALANGDANGCVLIPCDESHPDVEGATMPWWRPVRRHRPHALGVIKLSPEVRGVYGRRILAPAGDPDRELSYKKRARFSK
jgi:hypothetical protein